MAKIQENPIKSHVYLILTRNSYPRAIELLIANEYARDQKTAEDIIEKYLGKQPRNKA